MRRATSTTTSTTTATATTAPEALRSRRTRLAVTAGGLLSLAMGGFVVGPWAVQPAAAAGPPVVIEANFSGTLTSHPADHHTAAATVDAQSGEPADWAADYGVAAGTAITPQLNGPYGTTLTVIDVTPSCGGGAEGGTAVKVQVNEPGGGPEIGWVSYLHLSNVAVSIGQTVSTDTVLGTVGDGFPVNDACWTGPHLHVEGFNRSQYSCYYAPASVSPGTALGRIGGSDIGAPRTACP